MGAAVLDDVCRSLRHGEQKGGHVVLPVLHNDRVQSPLVGKHDGIPNTIVNLTDTACRCGPSGIPTRSYRSRETHLCRDGTSGIRHIHDAGLPQTTVCIAADELRGEVLCIRDEQVVARCHRGNYTAAVYCGTGCFGGLWDAVECTAVVINLRSQVMLAESPFGRVGFIRVRCREFELPGGHRDSDLS